MHFDYVNIFVNPTLKKLTEDDYDFTFTDFEVPVTADAWHNCNYFIFKGDKKDEFSWCIVKYW